MALLNLLSKLPGRLPPRDQSAHHPGQSIFHQSDLQTSSYRGQPSHTASPPKPATHQTPAYQSASIPLSSERRNLEKQRGDEGRLTQLETLFQSGTSLQGVDKADYELLSRKEWIQELRVLRLREQLRAADDGATPLALPSWPLGSIAPDTPAPHLAYGRLDDSKLPPKPAQSDLSRGRRSKDVLPRLLP